MPEAGVLYVLTNLAMPGIVKIGCTSGLVEDRIKELSSSTGVPIPFECHFAAQVSDFKAKERILHQLFGDNRLNAKREFFRVDPEKVVLAIQMGDFDELTPGKPALDTADEQALTRERVSDQERRSRINLTAIGIAPGTVLTLSRDETVQATTLGGNLVDFKGQQLSISAAALLALRQLGYQTNAASGSHYWMKDGETLDEIRRKVEQAREEL